MRIAATVLMWLCCVCPRLLALSGSTATNGSNAQAVHALGITGDGIKIGFISAGNVRTTHEAFAGPTGTRVFNHDYSGSGIGISPHDTQVAGIMVSAGGAMYPQHIGVAPQAVVHSARVVSSELQISPAWLDSALHDLIDHQQCSVIVTGIQLEGLTADGNSVWTKIYDYYAQYYDVVFANASGNSLPAVTVFGDAYNGITTAGLAETELNFYLQVGSLSNIGPTANGRRKPEIGGPTTNQTVPDSAGDTAWTTVDTQGQGLTSYAAPHTAGGAALLLEYAGQSAEPYDGKSEVIKAVLVNSAFPNIRNKLGQLTYPAQPGNVWNSHRGYGRIDLLRAYQTLEAGRISEGATANQAKGWAYETMTQNFQTDHFYLTCQKNQRLVLTVTWHRKLSESLEEENPRFTLNLKIISPLGVEAFTESNTLNNLEKADVLLGESGVYEVVIANPTTAKNRSYAMAFELLEPMAGDFDINYIVDVADLSALLGWWLEPGCGSIANCLSVDLTADEKIDLQDTGVFSTQWLRTDGRYWPVE